MSDTGMRKMSDLFKARVFSEAAELVSRHADPAYMGDGDDYAAGYRSGILDAVRALRSRESTLLSPLPCGCDTPLNAIHVLTHEGSASGG